jgi:hypothetical protein
MSNLWGSLHSEHLRARESAPKASHCIMACLKVWDFKIDSYCLQESRSSDDSREQRETGSTEKSV